MPPPRKENHTLLIVVVVVIALVVAIPVILFLMFFAAAPTIVPTKPVVTFSAVSMQQDNATFTVATVSRDTNFAFFEAALEVDSVPSSSRSVVFSPSYTTLDVGTDTYRVYWTDSNSNFFVDEGDRFRVTGDGVALPSGRDFVFSLHWIIDNDLLGSVSWST